MLRIKSHKNKIFILSIILVAIFSIVNFVNNGVKVATGEIKELSSDKLSSAILTFSAGIPRSIHFKVIP